MTTESLLRALAADPMARLRWHVLRTFGVSPGGADDAAMSDGDILIAAANLVLDRRQGGKTKEAGGNPAFDEARFARLREDEA
jgi:hypothetical protein